MSNLTCGIWGSVNLVRKFLDLTGIIKIISAVNVERVTFNMPEGRFAEEPTGGRSCRYGECIKAKKEVIISSGTYNSPKVLMLSGIGDEKTLAGHGIDCILRQPKCRQESIRTSVICDSVQIEGTCRLRRT